MDRKKFLKTSVFGAGSLIATPALLAANDNRQPETTDTIGYNHLPNKNDKIMTNAVLHKAETRGFADHGWLKSYHTFSFANYHNPNRMGFGLLRVLNDDTVVGGMGFGTHPHRNMEIISIPLEGDLEHKDSMGNTTVISNGDVQVMSAGTGVQHSEYNKNRDKSVKFLQIWVFPRKQGVTPRYDQITLNPADRKNKLQQILSPNPDDAGVWIHQDAWFYMGDFDKGKTTTYKINKNGNGIYFFVLNGKVKIADQDLETRDGFGIWNTSAVNISANEKTELLVMEVPMG